MLNMTKATESKATDGEIPAPSAEPPKKLPKMGNWILAISMSTLVLGVAIGADILIKVGGHPDGLPEAAWLAVGGFIATLSNQSERILSYYTGEAK